VHFRKPEKGNFKQGSDVDISLKGKSLSVHIAAAIQEELNEETQMRIANFQLRIGDLKLTMFLSILNIRSEDE
jgi:hypothetical protein